MLEIGHRLHPLLKRRLVECMADAKLPRYALGRYSEIDEVEEALGGHRIEQLLGKFLFAAGSVESGQVNRWYWRCELRRK